jgi:hypothetical protein
VSGVTLLLLLMALAIGLKRAGHCMTDSKACRQAIDYGMESWIIMGWDWDEG